MAIPTLSGSYIDETYGRLVQISGSEYADGFGNPISFGGGPGGAINTIQINKDGTNFTGSANLTFVGNNINLTGSILMSGSSYISGVDYIDFDQTAVNAGAVGRLKWNDTDGTLDLGLKGGNVTLQIGQEQVVRVVNKTGANLLESQYKVVRVRRSDEGGAQGQRLAIVLAQANNDANSVDTLGLVTENINVNQEGFITTTGFVRGIDTRGTLQGETWNEGDVLYLSPTTAGQVTNIKPQAPNHTVILGYVVYKQQNNGIIFVKVDNGYEIDELHNVRINTGSLAYGDLLMYSSSVWINSKSLSGSYSITGSLNVSGSSTSITGPFTVQNSISTNDSTKKFGQIGGGNNYFEVEADSWLATIIGGNQTGIFINTQNRTYLFGDRVNNNTRLLIDDIAQTINMSGSVIFNGNVTSTGVFSGSFAGGFSGAFAEKMTTTTLGNTDPLDIDITTDITITETGTYIISSIIIATTGYIYFPDPSLYVGQKIRIQNRTNRTANIATNGNEPIDISSSAITTINSYTTKTFIAGERTTGAYSWMEI